MDFDITICQTVILSFCIKYFPLFLSFPYIFWFSIIVFIFHNHRCFCILAPAWNLFLRSWSPQPRFIPIHFLNQTRFCNCLHGIHCFSMLFLSVRYDFTRIYTLLVSDFLYKASGWTKWRLLSWIKKMKISFEIVYLETLVKGLQLFFIFFQVEGPSGVASNQVESLIAKVEGHGPWTTANLNPCSLQEEMSHYPDTIWTWSRLVFGNLHKHNNRFCNEK